MSPSRVFLNYSTSTQRQMGMYTLHNNSLMPSEHKGNHFLFEPSQTAMRSRLSVAGGYRRDTPPAESILSNIKGTIVRQYFMT